MAKNTVQVSHTLQTEGLDDNKQLSPGQREKGHEIQWRSEKSTNTGGQACSISLSKGGYLFASE